ncbi:hypothetical protein V2J09_005667 [Rumex salicifolius]
MADVAGLNDIPLLTHEHVDVALITTFSFHLPLGVPDVLFIMGIAIHEKDMGVHDPKITSMDPPNVKRQLGQEAVKDLKLPVKISWICLYFPMFAPPTRADWNEDAPMPYAAKFDLSENLGVSQQIPQDPIAPLKAFRLEKIQKYMVSYDKARYAWDAQHIHSFSLEALGPQTAITDVHGRLSPYCEYEDDDVATTIQFSLERVFYEPMDEIMDV